MILLLYITGGIILTISFISGLTTGSIMLFLLQISSGILGALLFFALAKILDNQEYIRYSLMNGQNQTKQDLTGSKICNRCKSKYNKNQLSCPYCGNRD